MSKAVALQLDPIESLNPAGDSSILIGLEAQRRGYDLYYYQAHQLSSNDGVIQAPLTKLTLKESADDFYQLGQTQVMDLKQMDVIWMRQDPPFDMGYITATYLLEQLGDDVLVLNHPAHVRDFPEKLFPLIYKEYAPETLISSDKDAVQAFLKKHEKIVMKPLYGFGGHSVYVISPDDANTKALLESALANPREPWVFQPFLPEVKDKEVRIIIVDGEVIAAVGRQPVGSDIRSNLRVGGQAVTTSLTPKQQEVCQALAPLLKEKKLMLVGLDMIGDYLIEINITSPTTLKTANALYDIRTEQRLWDAVERYL